ncbi:NUDIX domain-containing protein [Kineosporia succinea]|uniref:8-oxo-dGTP pyrophosphatase MutT (NUDIX family) n=1 Tax=Kineosporia succinea TaxID=84632 RepID=A0ABT9P621_9ACTN|nr:NUDIX domain-containing protein [Kineosporia succinea]MDP9827879.1 8-oxo-dGTP pyrophosphatase MutT (NUDIX family) [Kineosporia succinea]
MKIRRARVVTLAPSGRVAMIERYVRGHRFLSVPGGRLEPGESPEEAAVREVEEELGLRVTLAGRLPDHEGQAYFLAVVPDEAKLTMSGPETKHANRNNRYTPRWVDAATLDGLPLRQPVRQLVTTAALAVSATVATVKPSVHEEGVVGPNVPRSAQKPTEPATETAEVLDLTTLPEPRPEFDPAAATFGFGSRFRRRFTLLASSRTQRGDRVGARR